METERCEYGSMQSGFELHELDFWILSANQNPSENVGGQKTLCQGQVVQCTITGRGDGSMVH